MPSQFDALKVRRDEPIDEDFFNRRFRLVDDRLVSLETLKIAWEEALRVVQDRVLSRSEDVIAALRDQLVSITQLEWLTAHSETARTLANDAVFSLEIIEADRPLFTPGPYSMLTRTTDPSTWAIVRTLGYDRQSGQWDVRVESFVGAPGPHSDWEIAAVAGSTLAQKAYLAQGEAARDEAASARDEAVSARVTAVAAKDVAVAAKDVAVAAKDVAVAAAEAAQAAAEGAAAQDPATLASTGTFSLKAEVTPPQITSDAVDDYNPAGLAVAAVARISSDQPGRMITGFGGGSDGRLLIVQNVGAYAIRLGDGAGVTTSLAANRLALGGSHYDLAPGASLALIYDETAARWRPVGPLDPSPSRNFALAAAITF